MTQLTVPIIATVIGEGGKVDTPIGGAKPAKVQGEPWSALPPTTALRAP